MPRKAILFKRPARAEPEAHRSFIQSYSDEKGIVLWLASDRFHSVIRRLTDRAADKSLINTMRGSGALCIRSYKPDDSKEVSFDLRTIGKYWGSDQPENLNTPFNRGLRVVATALNVCNELAENDGDSSGISMRLTVPGSEPGPLPIRMWAAIPELHRPAFAEVAVRFMLQASAHLGYIEQPGVQVDPVVTFTDRSLTIELEKGNSQMPRLTTVHENAPSNDRFQLLTQPHEMPLLPVQSICLAVAGLAVPAAAQRVLVHQDFLPDRY